MIYRQEWTIVYQRFLGFYSPPMSIFSDEVLYAVLTSSSQGSLPTSSLHLGPIQFHPRRREEQDAPIFLAEMALLLGECEKLAGGGEIQWTHKATLFILARFIGCFIACHVSGRGGGSVKLNSKINRKFSRKLNASPV